MRSGGGHGATWKRAKALDPAHFDLAVLEEAEQEFEQSGLGRQYGLRFHAAAKLLLQPFDAGGADGDPQLGREAVKGEQPIAGFPDDVGRLVDSSSRRIRHPFFYSFRETTNGLDPGDDQYQRQSGEDCLNDPYTEDPKIFEACGGFAGFAGGGGAWNLFQIDPFSLIGIPVVTDSSFLSPQLISQIKSSNGQAAERVLVNHCPHQGKASALPLAPEEKTDRALQRRRERCRLCEARWL